MAAEILTLINTFKDPILKKLKDVKDKAINFFDTGLYQYLKVQKEKHEYTKTFLFRDQQIRFYDTFFPVSLIKTQRNNSDKINTGNNCFSIFDNLSYQKNFVMIIGYAGSGKSMLMKHFFLECIDKLYRIPIFIELRTFNNFRGSFLEYITNILFTNRVVPFENMGILKRILNEGKILFLLDGFDEIYSEHKYKILEDLNNFIDAYSENLFIITSRPGTNIESFSRFHNFYVCDLESTQVTSFITQQLKSINEPQLAEQIITTIQKPENNEYINYLTSPLLLSMFILTYNSHPELPRTKAKFYFNVFDTLLTKHDSIKMPGYQHQRTSNLLNEQIEIVLKWFSYISFFEGQYSFSKKYIQGKFNILSDKLKIPFDIESLIYDLSISISIFLKDGIEYRFPHRTLQEFFSALLISEQKTEIKTKIYTEKFNTLEQKSHSGNDNFLNLCVELDENSFYKNWAIPNLQNHVKQIIKYNEDNEIDKKETIINFVNSFEIEGSFEIHKGTKGTEIIYSSKKEFVIIKKLFSLLKMNTEFSIINSLKVESFDLQMRDYLMELIEKKVLDKDKSKSNAFENVYTFPVSKFWNSGFFKLIENSEIPNKIDRYLANIDEKIKSLENEIEENEKTKIDLLDL